MKLLQPIAALFSTGQLLTATFARLPETGTLRMAAGVGGGPPCADDSPEPFYPAQGLYLRPLSRIIIFVKLPQLKTMGQSISNWDLMERLKKAIMPIQLEGIKVRESSLEAVSFEAELSSRLNMHRVIQGLDGLSLKVSGFVDTLKVKAAEAKSEFPTRIDWDDHFYKSGRRGVHPDTVYLAMVPVNWFRSGKDDLPCEKLLRAAMSGFGKIRMVDIPCCDPLRRQMAESISGVAKKAYSFGQEVLFEAYVQYEDYKGFINAMDRLRNQKWMRRMPDGRIFYANVKVDFDRDWHLSETKVRLREAAAARLSDEQRKKAEEERRAKEEEAERILKEQMDKEKRKEERELKRKIEYELERRRLERKRLLEQRLADEEKEWAARMVDGAKRLLGYVFERIQTRADHERAEREAELRAELAKAKESDLQAVYVDDESNLRAALMKQREARMRERLKEKMMAAMEEKKKKVEEEKEIEEGEITREEEEQNGLTNRLKQAKKLVKVEGKVEEKKEKHDVKVEEHRKSRHIKKRKKHNKKASREASSSSSAATYSDDEDVRHHHHKKKRRSGEEGKKRSRSHSLHKSDKHRKDSRGEGNGDGGKKRNGSRSEHKADTHRRDSKEEEKMKKKKRRSDTPPLKEHKKKR